MTIMSQFSWTSVHLSKSSITNEWPYDFVEGTDMYCETLCTDVAIVMIVRHLMHATSLVFAYTHGTRGHKVPIQRYSLGISHHFPFSVLVIPWWVHNFLLCISIRHRLSNNQNTSGKKNMWTVEQLWHFWNVICLSNREPELGAFDHLRSLKRLMDEASCVAMRSCSFSTAW
jgi:hypothetical protein